MPAFYEDLMEPRIGGGLFGYRAVEELPPGREAGYQDKQPISITEPLTLLKGHKQVVLQASPAKPVEAWSIFYSTQP